MKLLLLLTLLADPGTPAAPPDVELLDFTASYCQPCRQMLPIIQRMEQDRFPVRRVDISDEPDLSAKFRITGVPTLIVMVEGREVKRFVGLTSESVLREAMLRASRELQEKREALAPPASVAQVAPEKPESVKSESLQTSDEGDNENSDASGAAAPRRSLADVFQRVFGGGSRAPGVIRGQSPSNDLPQSGIELAEKATVRIQVEGRSTESGRAVREVGTGTVFHSVPEETYVLTCAHFFLDLQKSGSTVTVEVFEKGRPEAFAASVVGGSHTLDLAVVRITPKRVLAAVRIEPTALEVSPGEKMVSFGCDAGKTPSRLETELLAVNRYLGPDNLVCAKDPASGRSGGGLYTDTGALAGVCSCAVREKSQGLYMASKSVLALLQELKLSYLLEGGAADSKSEPGSEPLLADAEPWDSGSEPASETGTGTESAADSKAVTVETSVPEQELEFDPLAAGSDVTEGGISKESEPSAAGESAAAALSAGPEVTIIIDEKTPGSQKKVIVIPRASVWLMEMLTGEGLGEDSTGARRRGGTVRPAGAESPGSGSRGAPRATYPEGQ
ncbi:MAG: trypsin-like peptidase domain-containing protein [Planctomycetaceae bacterium]